MIDAEPAAAAAWSHVPVDDVGYIGSRELFAYTDDQLRDVIRAVEKTRYDPAGWRNHRGLWRDRLGLDRTRGGRVLDYGCGIGVEALQYAKLGNQVWLADIVADNVELAARVLDVHGYTPAGQTVIPEAGLNVLPTDLDVVHCAGVLHHIRDPLPTVIRFHEILRAHGELRLMVYSDVGWRVATGQEPPGDVANDPHREMFVRFMDEVGDWADWYHGEKLTDRFGDWFTVERVTHITPNWQYLVATLKPRLDVGVHAGTAHDWTATRYPQQEPT